MINLVSVNNSVFEITVIPGTPPVPPIMQIFPKAGIPPYFFGVNDVSTNASDTVKVEGDKCLTKDIQQKSIYSPPATGTVDDFGCNVIGSLITTWVSKGKFKIEAGSVKCFNLGEKLMLENDETQLLNKCSCAGSYVAGSTAINCEGNCTVKITKAGQSVTRMI